MKKRGLIITILLAICVVGCGAPEDSNVSNQPKVSVEESVEVQQPVEEEAMIVEKTTEETITLEEQEEDSTANLSNEEWVNSLNVDRPTFLVFNEFTGGRKALEDGAEYILVEGDELAIEIPSRWLWQGDNISIYSTKENKYNCVVYTLNYDMIGEKTEFTTTYNNREGQPVTVTVYLSK